MANKSTAHNTHNANGTSSSKEAELQNLVAYYKKSSTRLEAARSLAERRNQLVKETADHILKLFPFELSTDHKTACCLRDIEYFIKVLEYCLVSDSTKPANEILNGLREMYLALGLSLSCCLEALSFIRNNHGLIADQALEANTYIDFMLAALS
jgi:hypothetical protein